MSLSGMEVVKKLISIFGLSYLLFIISANTNLKKMDELSEEDRYGNRYDGSRQIRTCSWETSEFQEYYYGWNYRLCIDYKNKTIYSIVRQANHKHIFYKKRENGFFNKSEDVKDWVFTNEWRRYKWKVEGDNLVRYECGLGSNKNIFSSCKEESTYRYIEGFRSKVPD